MAVAWLPSRSTAPRSSRSSRDRPGPRCRDRSLPVRAPPRRRVEHGGRVGIRADADAGDDGLAAPGRGPDWRRSSRARSPRANGSHSAGRNCLAGRRLLLIARANGADAPYLTLKTIYLAIYPLAVGGAIAASAFARSAEASRSTENDDVRAVTRATGPRGDGSPPRVLCAVGCPLAGRRGFSSRWLYHFGRAARLGPRRDRCRSCQTELLERAAGRGATCRRPASTTSSPTTTALTGCTWSCWEIREPPHGRSPARRSSRRRQSSAGFFRVACRTRSRRTRGAAARHPNQRRHARAFRTGGRDQAAGRRLLSLRSDPRSDPGSDPGSDPHLRLAPSCPSCPSCLSCPSRPTSSAPGS